MSNQRKHLSHSRSTHLLWECSLVPVKNPPTVLIIFLETGEFFFDNDAASIMEMVRCVFIWISLHTSGHSRPIYLYLILAHGPSTYCSAYKELEPEISILHVKKFFIIVEREAWHCSFKIYSVSSHPMLELLCFLWGHSI